MYQILSVSEKEELLSEPNPQYATELRNLIYLHMSLDNGLSMEQLSNMTWSQIDSANGSVMVDLPESRIQQRIVLLSEPLETLLEEWKGRQVSEWKKRKHSKKGPDNKPDHVFTNLDGTPLKQEYIYKMVAMYSESAGIKKKLVPEDLHHKNFEENIV